MNPKDLQALRAADVARCDKTGLADLREVRFSVDGAPAEKLRGFLAAVKNPYLFCVGNVAVRIEYCGERSLTEALLSALKAS